MKTLKLSFDLSDQTELVELMRLEAARKKISQKGILVSALKSYFANNIESEMLKKMAEKSFVEWNSDADQAYDDL